MLNKIDRVILRIKMNSASSVGLLTLKISYSRVCVLKLIESGIPAIRGSAARNLRNYSLITPGVCLRSDRFSLCGECPFVFHPPTIRCRYSAGKHRHV